MAALTCIITALAVYVAIVTEMAHAQYASKRCGLFEYYDVHMDSCGPCREICHAMKITRTEEQCKAQCSDYLIAANCTYNQYYDDVVSSCAPCFELCTHSEVKGTSDQCSEKCHNYLKAQNCTEDEYFNDRSMTCTACSQLCSQHDEHGDTIQDCFHKCPQYVERYPPGNIVGLPDGGPDIGSPAKTQTVPGENKTSVHPGLIVTIAIGVVCIIATVGVALHLVKTRRRPTYTSAPSAETTEGEVEGEENVTPTAHLNIEMEGLVAEPTQQMSCPTSSRRQDTEENHGNGVKFGIEERDPYASSAPCFLQLIRD